MVSNSRSLNNVSWSSYTLVAIQEDVVEIIISLVKFFFFLSGQNKSSLIYKCGAVRRAGGPEFNPWIWD